MDCWPPLPPLCLEGFHHMSAPLFLGFICAQCPADVCLQIALHQPHLTPAVLTRSWCSPFPTGATLLGMELGAVLGTPPGIEKTPPHLNPPHSQSVTQQKEGAQGLGVSGFGTHTLSTSCWLTQNCHLEAHFSTSRFPSSQDST